MHSNYSDGELSPSQLFIEAKLQNLYAVSLTDHDTIKGLQEAESAALINDIKFLPGIELSSSSSAMEVHILGYNIPFKDSAFLQELNSIIELRKKRNEEIVRKLRSQGISLKVGDLFDSGVKGRQHIATKLLEQGYVRSRAEAFDKYIGTNKPCFVKSFRIAADSAIKLIKEYEGVPILAHPMRYSTRTAIAELVNNLADFGLMGLEVFYPNQHREDDLFLRNLAERHNLIMTGGSDFHSISYGATIGSSNAYLDENALKILKIV